MDETTSALALRESEELHRITLLSMSDAVFITNDEGAFTFICPNVDVIFGYGQDEVRAMERISRLLGRELIEPAQLAAAGEVRNIEHEIETKAGTRRILLVHIKQVSIRQGTVLYCCRDITERKQLERVMATNEQRLTLALEAASAGTWDWHVPSGEMNWSLETHRLFGDSGNRRAPSLDAFLDCLHPSDRERVTRSMTDAMDRGGSYETEFRVRGYDGTERWVMARGKALRNGKPLRMLGVFVDFSQRHDAEQELRDLGGRLINAHEQERQRVSRELHDDVGQRLAILSVDLELARRQLTTAPAHVLDEIGKLSDQVQEISSVLHRVSHELHPARLEQLGLEGSIRSLCNDFAKAREIAVDLEVSPGAPVVDRDVALCLYRIAQEALHNVIRHSRATQAKVALESIAGRARLTVVDDGVGFDPKAAHRQDALGLVSMRERARLVHGHFALVSTPGTGTRVEVVVPLTASRRC